MPIAAHDVELLKVLTEQSSMDIVRLLLRDGPARQRDVAAELGLTAVVVSRALNGLERSGIVHTEGKRAPYEIVYPPKTEALVQAAADLSDFILRDMSSRARERAAELRKARLRGTPRQASLDGSA
jgi:DNA-binding Lrp family transcriptional regulator